MRPSVLVTEYLNKLSGELRFDPQLSRRVRLEVEDHLLNAIADNAGFSQTEAARLAIARFGDPREIARQYAPLSLLQQTQRVGGILIVAIAAILVLMKGRVELYDLLHWRLNVDWLGGVGAIVLTIDRYAFQMSLVLGILGWLYIASRPTAPTLNGAYQQQLERCLLLSASAAGLLFGAVTLDTILAGARFIGVGMSLAAMIPLLSIAIEVVLVGVIIVELRKVIQRKALILSLFADKNTNH